MSGIGYQPNKFDTCDGSTDRTVEPNCHATCSGYLYRKAELEKLNKERRENFDYYEYKTEVVQKAKKREEK